MLSNIGYQTLKTLVKTSVFVIGAIVFFYSAIALSQSSTITAATDVNVPIAPTPTRSEEIEPEEALTDYDSIQAIRFEVQTLRGKVEELEYNIEQLKKQRIQDYLDLDRRINELTQRSGNWSDQQNTAPTQSYVDGINETSTTSHSFTANTDTNTNSSISPFGSGTVDSVEGSSITTTNILNNDSKPSLSVEDYYQQATSLLRNKKADEALKSFYEIQLAYPQTKYAANSLFWMGKIYQIKKKNELARQQYVQFLQRFYTHRKAGEVAYFLGKIYFELNDQEQTLQLMNRALQSSDPKVVSLANRFLELNGLSVDSEQKSEQELEEQQATEILEPQQQNEVMTIAEDATASL